MKAIKILIIALLFISCEKDEVCDDGTIIAATQLSPNWGRITTKFWVRNDCDNTIRFYHKPGAYFVGDKYKE